MRLHGTWSPCGYTAHERDIVRRAGPMFTSVRLIVWTDKNNSLERDGVHSSLNGPIDSHHSSEDPLRVSWRRSKFPCASQVDRWSHASSGKSQSEGHGVSDGRHSQQMKAKFPCVIGRSIWKAIEHNSFPMRITARVMRVCMYLHHVILIE